MSDDIKVMEGPVATALGIPIECTRCHSWHVRNDLETIGWECLLCGNKWGGIDTWPSVEVKVKLDPKFRFSVVGNGKLMDNLDNHSSGGFLNLVDYAPTEDRKRIRFRPDSLSDGMILVAGFMFGGVVGRWRVFKLRNNISFEEVSEEEALEAASRDYR